jgi:hypothetical protein
VAKVGRLAQPSREHVDSWTRPSCEGEVKCGSGENSKPSDLCQQPSFPLPWPRTICLWRIYVSTLLSFLSSQGSLAIWLSVWLFSISQLSSLSARQWMASDVWVTRRTPEFKLIPLSGLSPCMGRAGLVGMDPCSCSSTTRPRANLGH